MTTTANRSSESLLDQARALKDTLQRWRQRIHRQPELSFAEVETSKLVAAELTKLGYTVRQGIAGTGVIGDIGSGKTIIVRADLDALPIEEISTCSYKSEKSGVMHACGHDAHVACALGAASLIASAFKSGAMPTGRVRILFQPAEESVNEFGKSGAAMMIEERALEGAEAMIALHVFPDIPVGQVSVKEGQFLAACDSFDIKINGSQSHGAYPQEGIDAIVLAAQVVQAIQTIVSRRKSALDPAVVTLGGIKSTTYRHNIIAEEVDLTGTARYFDPVLHEQIRTELERACSITEAMGGSYSMKYVQDNPPVVNDPDITSLVRRAAEKILGSSSILEGSLQMGADDFGFFANQMPSCYFFLGAELAGDRRKLHTPTFDIDENALSIGAALLAEAALNFIKQS